MNVLLVKYGEIALRGKNRYLFENRLSNLIKEKIKGLGAYTVSKEQGRLLVKSLGNMDYDKLIPIVLSTPGVVAVCPAVLLTDRAIEDLKIASLNYMKEQYPSESYTFKVETKRCDKKYPLNSQEISATIGECIIEGADNFTVNVKLPDITLHVELRNDVYIYSKVIKGYGGLPVGSSGKGLVLLSGGIDSPVAAFLMAKRGVEIEAVYFHSPPFVSERAKIKVMDLAERLSFFMGSVTLNIVPFTDIQLLIKDNCPPEKLTILLKRSMLRTAQKIAEKIKAEALITGDSVGQVASQTIRSINACNSAVSMPILRPLAGMNKQEIVDIAKNIETLEISIRPYEDCCTLFVAEHPETRPKTSVIEYMEAKILNQLEALIDIAVENREIFSKN